MLMEGLLLNLKKYKEKVLYNILLGIVNYVDLLGRIERWNYRKLRFYLFIICCLDFVGILLFSRK